MLGELSDQQIAQWKAIRDKVAMDIENWSTEYDKAVIFKGIAEALNEAKAAEVNRKVRRLDI